MKACQRFETMAANAKDWSKIWDCTVVWLLSLGQLSVTARTVAASLLCPWDSQASTLEWTVVSFFKGSSQARDLNPCLLRLLHWQVDSLLMNHQGNSLELHKLSQIARKQSDKLRNILQNNRLCSSKMSVLFKTK